MKTCKRGLHQFEGRRCVECCKLRYTEYCAKNREKVNAQSRERYTKNPERAKEYVSNYKKKNSEKLKIARKSRVFKQKQIKNREEALKLLGLE